MGRYRPQNRPNKLTWAQRWEMVEMTLNGSTRQEAADKFGVSVHAVAYWITQYHKDHSFTGLDLGKRITVTCEHYTCHRMFDTLESRRQRFCSPSCSSSANSPGYARKKQQWLSGQQRKTQ